GRLGVRLLGGLGGVLLLGRAVERLDRLLGLGDVAAARVRLAISAERRRRLRLERELVGAVVLALDRLLLVELERPELEVDPVVLGAPRAVRVVPPVRVRREEVGGERG